MIFSKEKGEKKKERIKEENCPRSYRWLVPLAGFAQWRLQGEEDATIPEKYGGKEKVTFRIIEQYTIFNNYENFIFH